MREFHILNWQRVPDPRYDPKQIYEKFLIAQDDVWEQRLLNLIPDTLIITHHPPTITINDCFVLEQLRHIRVLPPELFDSIDEANAVSIEKLFENAKMFLAGKFGIHLVRVNRGGRVWYHDEGVLQLYVVAELGSDLVSEITRPLEEVLYQTVSRFGLPAERPGERWEKENNAYIGVWVNGKKIGAVGIRVESENFRKITKFGAALNVKPDLRSLAMIDPCGIEGKEATSLAKELGQYFYLDHDRVLGILYTIFENVFGAEFTKKTPPQQGF